MLSQCQFFVNLVNHVNLVRRLPSCPLVNLTLLTVLTVLTTACSRGMTSLKHPNIPSKPPAASRRPPFQGVDSFALRAAFAPRSPARGGDPATAFTPLAHSYDLCRACPARRRRDDKIECCIGKQTRHQARLRGIRTALLWRQPQNAPCSRLNTSKSKQSTDR